MENCKSFQTCSAPLCPLDKDINRRIWYADENICSGRPGSGKRWINKQRSIQRRQTKSYLNRPVTYQELFKNSRPMQLSDEQRQNLKDRMLKIHQMSK